MSNDNVKSETKSLRTMPWSRVHLYERREVDGKPEFRAVFDNGTKARVLSEFRDTRKLRSGYSFFPMDIVFSFTYTHDCVIHFMSLLWYRFNETRQCFDRVLDPNTIAKLSGALSCGDTIPDGFTTLNYAIEWNGIDDKAKPFNPIRVKL